MHTVTEYKELQSKIKAEEGKLNLLDQEKIDTKKKIEKLKNLETEMVKKTIGELEYQKQHERNIKDSKEYFEMIKRWQEEGKDNEPILLDRLTDHYRAILSNLSNNIKSIIYVVVKEGKPLTTKEISTNKVFRNEKQITSSYISATLNGKGMYSIPKNKSYEFEILKRNNEGKIIISDNDLYFIKWLEMSFKSL